MKLPTYLITALYALTNSTTEQESAAARYEVTQHVAHPVLPHPTLTTITATTTVTTTVTVGIVATPVDHTPAVVPASLVATNWQPRRPPVSNFSPPVAPAQQVLSFDAASLLSSFGQWAVEPIKIEISPWQIYKWTSVLLLLTSLYCFMATTIHHRYYVQRLIDNFMIAFWGGSNVLWVFIFGGIHLIVGERNFNPLECVCCVLMNLPKHSPSKITRFIQVVPEYFFSHVPRGERGYSIIVKAVIADFGPPLVAAWRIVLRKVLWQIPRLTELVIDFVTTCLTYLFQFCCWVFGIICVAVRWLYLEHLCPIGRLIGYIFKRLWPTRLIIYLRTNFYLEARHPQDSDERLYAANMTLEQRMEAVRKIERLQSDIDQYNDGFVKNVGKRCLDYRKTIHALLKEANYFRSVIDLWSNEMYRLEHNQDPITASKPYKSSKLYWSPTLTKRGLHYDLGGRSETYIGTHYTQRPVRVEDSTDPFATTTRLGPGKAPKAKSTGIRKFNPNPLKTGTLKMELFQDTAWGVKAHWKMPPYDTPKPLFGEAEQVTEQLALKEEEPCLEDVAASGGGLKHWEKEQATRKKWLMKISKSAAAQLR